MKFNLNGVEVEVPEGTSVDISSDGKKVKISPPAAKTVEKIRVIEREGPERIVERIRIVEVEKPIPCTRPHYPSPSWPSYPSYPWTITCGGTGTNPNTITTGTAIWKSGNSSFTV